MYNFFLQQRPQFWAGLRDRKGKRHQQQGPHVGAPGQKISLIKEAQLKKENFFNEYYFRR